MYVGGRPTYRADIPDRRAWQTMMTEYDQRQPSVAAFVTLMAVGLGLSVLSFAVPLFSDSDLTLFEGDGTGSATFFAVLGIPIVIGLVGAKQSPLFAGLAAGASVLLGTMLSFVWLGAVAAVVDGEGFIEVGVGTVLMGAGSMALVIGALVSLPQRRRAMNGSRAVTPVGLIGCAAVVMTIVGLGMPPEFQTTSEWFGFISGLSPLNGVPSVLLLAGLAFAGLVGFWSGRWGVGMVIGWVAPAAAGGAIGEAEANSANGSVVADFFRSGWDLQTVAHIGFWATVVLAVVHAIVLASSSGAHAAAAFASASGAAGQWSSDPFGRHAQRYWDGSRWTEHVADQGVASFDPPVPSAPGSGASGPSPAPSPVPPYASAPPPPSVSPAPSPPSYASAPPPPSASAPSPPSYASAPSPPSPSAAPAALVGDPYAPFRPAPSASSGLSAFDQEHTMVRGATASPPAAGAADRDGRTLSRAELEALQRGAQIPAASAPSSVPAHVVLFDDGSRLPLTSTMVIGRDPSAASVPAGATAHRIHDPSMSISKTHLLIGVAGGDVWVEDLGSVNGTSIVTEGGFATEVSPGQRLPVTPGSTISFGDRSCKVIR